MSSEKSKRRQEISNKFRDCLNNSLGGKCQICRENHPRAIYDCHHVNPKEKDFTISDGKINKKNFPKYVKEYKKCVLLCANCHRYFHSNLKKIPKRYQQFNERIFWKSIKEMFPTEYESLKFVYETIDKNEGVYYVEK